MNTKLTLSIEKSVIERAKAYAKGSGRSLSDLIESYLRSLTARTPTRDDDLPEALQDLFGAISLPEDFDEKEQIRKMMRDKHS